MIKLAVAVIVVVLCFGLYWVWDLEQTRVEKARRTAAVALEEGEFALARKAIAYGKTSMDYEVRRLADEQLFYLELTQGHLRKAGEQAQRMMVDYRLNQATLLAMADFAMAKEYPGVAHRLLDQLERILPEYRGDYKDRRKRWRAWCKENETGAAIYNKHRCPFE